MEFAIITPTAGLERYATLSKTHLVLAHEWKGDYATFYTERRSMGDFIIFDNGAYERGVPEIDLYEVGLLRPNVIVLPDFPLAPWKKTWHAAIAFLDQVYGKIDSEFLYIPQAEKGDLHGFLESYLEAVQDSRITWLGIPRALAYAITDDPLARVEFARMVRKDHPHLKLHAFGMVNGDVHEIPYLSAAGVESIDSSAPVWRGWNGYTLNTPDAWAKFGPPVDFNAPWSMVNEGVYNGSVLIQHNLEACGVRISDRL